MLLGSGNHDLGDQPVGLRPGVGELGIPGWAEEAFQRGHQGGPDGHVVLGYH